MLSRELMLPAVGSYAMAYRFNLNGGPYLYCDTAGDATYNTANQALATVAAAPLAVTWCDLQFPASIAVAAGQDAGPVFGQVYVQSVTVPRGSPCARPPARPLWRIGTPPLRMMKFGARIRWALEVR